MMNEREYNIINKKINHLYEKPKYERIMPPKKPIPTTTELKLKII